MNKSESKYFNTAIKMDEALLSLLSEKDFQFITVKEICKKACVNRSTFYLHYETIGDLLTEALEYVTNRFSKKFKDFEAVITKEEIEDAPIKDLILITPQYLIPYFEFIKDNRHIFTAVIHQPAVIMANTIFNKICSDFLHPIMRRFNISEREIEYKLAYYIEGVFAVVCKWIENDCDDDIEQMANLIVECILPKVDEHF